MVGNALGDAVGDVLGDAFGDALGDTLGEAIGEALGDVVGAVGEAVGDEALTHSSQPFRESAPSDVHVMGCVTWTFMGASPASPEYATPSIVSTSSFRRVSKKVALTAVPDCTVIVHASLCP